MSQQIKNLQIKLGVEPDGDFGKITLLAFQEHYKLSASQVSHFFGQISHETGGFQIFSENLNYSAPGLLKTFPKYFTADNVQEYAGKPEKIANKVYSNRMSNGNEASGDGYRYRGRGSCQVTGRANYQAFSDYMKAPSIMSNPNLVLEVYAFDSALWFFDVNKLWSLCDKVDDASILAVTKKINGGQNGLTDRIEKTKKFYSWFK